MKLKPYPEYKDSGVPWLGKIPAHWGVLRSKYIFREIDTRSKTGEETHLSMSQIYGLVESSTIDGRRLQSESYVGSKVCKKNDLVLNRLKAHLGVFAHAPQDGVVSPDYSVFRLHPDGEVRFFEAIFRTPLYITELRRSTKGIVEGFWRLYTEDLYSIPVPVPPITEQQALLCWIDHFDRLVRQFIRSKRRLIDLLNEQKQAIIHRAVTCGLDPSIRLKPSGTDWLGNVPEHWEVKRLKSLVTEAVAGPYGSSLTKAMYTRQGYRVYGQQQVIPDDFSVGDYYISAEKFAEMARYRVFPQDVLVSVMGTVGRVAIVPETAEPGIINPRLVRYRPDFNRIRARYLQLMMQSPPSQAQFAEGAKGTTMEGLNMQILGKLLILVPPLHEQDAILTAVALETQRLVSAISGAQREISLLREYQTRLIADVVMGKLDVRGVELSELDKAEVAAEQDEEVAIVEDMNLDAEIDDEDLTAEV